MHDSPGFSTGWFCQIELHRKGGDFVDADGIPLYTITHWQKAQFLDQVCGARPRITLPRIGKMFFRGVSAGLMGSGRRSENAAFCW